MSDGMRGNTVGHILARYDAAVTTPGNRRHWANADGLSADAAARPDVRRALRNRARYEVANNSYAKGIVLTLANDVIGTGPRLQMLTEDREANRRIERAFMTWARAVGLAETLHTMRMTRAESGEAFMLLARNPRLASPVQLDLRLIEADQVTTPAASLPDAGAVDGIVFDEFGNPVEYHILRQHPGDTRWASSIAFDRVSADELIHYYRVDRPGQSRGVPDITPAIPLYAQLRTFTLAVIASAENAALIGGVIHTEAPADADIDHVKPLDEVEIDRSTWLTMPFGWKAGQFKAEQPVTTYAEFKHEILNEIARCLNVPFNVAAGNSSGYNYASGRLDHQSYFKSIRIEQAHIERVVLDRIFGAWLNEAVLIEGLLPQSMRGVGADTHHAWFWDGTEHVDPAKEANAQSTRLANGTTTLAREYARQGLDWEDQIAQAHIEAIRCDTNALIRAAQAKRIAGDLGLSDEEVTRVLACADSTDASAQLETTDAA